MQVKAKNDEGESAWSASGAGRTNAPPSPPAFAAATATREVAENHADEADVDPAVTATDPNGDPLTYSLSGTDAAQLLHHS